MVSAVSASTTPAACSQIPSDQSAVSLGQERGRHRAERRRRGEEAEGRRRAERQARRGQRPAGGGQRPERPELGGLVGPPHQHRRAGRTGVGCAGRGGPAQRDLDDTTLRAPVDGTVSAVNGTVGEFVGGQLEHLGARARQRRRPCPARTTAASARRSPGRRAAVPTRPGGTQFLVLDNVDEFQVVLAYTETDAATIAPGQKVRTHVRRRARPRADRIGALGRPRRRPRSPAWSATM